MTGSFPGPGAIELRDVRKRYGPIRAVDGISLQIESGEFLTVLGPSGCGKSTTLKVIGGFEPPDSGDVLLAGRSLGRTQPHRRPVNTVFQDYALFPHMSVEQNIMFGLRMAGISRDERQQRVDAATNLVRLDKGDRRKPFELSGGQQQRVALARALVNHPAVLLLDEPLGALDLKLRTEMQRELRELNRRLETTFLYVTHDQDEALAMSDRIAVMNRGQILQVGTPADIYDRPRTRFVADFIGQANILAGTLVSCRNGVAEVAVGGLGTLRATLPEGVAATAASVVWVAVRRENIEIGSQRNGTSAVNVLSGVVVEYIYFGSHSQVVVEVAGGTRVTVHVPSVSGSIPMFSGGQAVELSFAVDNTAVLLD